MIPVVPRRSESPLVAGQPEPGSKFENDVHHLFRQLESVLLSKHADYGPRNVSGSPGGALNGLRVRMHDKLARINHLVDTSERPMHESLEDSFLDLANYAVIAALVLRRQWPSA